MIVKIIGEFITIGQLLKKMNFISTGGEAKFFLENNQIKIDGKSPIGRNTKVFAKSTVWVNDNLFRVEN